MSVRNGTSAALDSPGPVRWTAAALLFLLGLVAPVAIPLLRQLGVSGATLVALSAALVFGIPEVLWMLAVAVLGKTGFEQGKQWACALLQRQAPPERVGGVRYRIGLVMFALPLIFAWLAPYVVHGWPGLVPSSLRVSIAGDALFGLSFFVLGGEFWDKVRALFVHGATARFP